MYSRQPSSPQQCLCSSTLSVHNKVDLSMFQQKVCAHVVITSITGTYHMVPERIHAHQLVCGFGSVTSKSPRAVTCGKRMQPALLANAFMTMHMNEQEQLPVHAA